MSQSGSTDAGSPVADDGLRSMRWLRRVAAVLGLAVLALGGVATFHTTNGAGSAALVVAGVALLIVGGLGDRIESLKIGDVEFRVRQLIRRADQLERRGDPEAAEQLREEADRLLLQASATARSYEEARRTQPPGPQRTSELYKSVDAARQFSRDEHPSAEIVRDLFDRGTDGDRVYALVLMEEDPATANLASVVDAISRSHSAFEQYRALAVAVKLVRRLDNSQRRQLSVAIRQEMGRGGYITPSTDRYGIAQRVLSMADIKAPSP